MGGILQVGLEERPKIKMHLGHTHTFRSIKCYLKKGFKKNKNKRKDYNKQRYIVRKVPEEHENHSIDQENKIVKDWYFPSLADWKNGKEIDRNGNIKKLRKTIWTHTKWLSLTEPAKE